MLVNQFSHTYIPGEPRSRKDIDAVTIASDVEREFQEVTDFFVTKDDIKGVDLNKKPGSIALNNVQMPESSDLAKGFVQVDGAVDVKISNMHSANKQTTFSRDETGGQVSLVQENYSERTTTKLIHNPDGTLTVNVDVFEFDR